MARDDNFHEEVARLVKRAQAGDADAFAELYRRTAQAQYFSLVGRVGEDAAGDLLQEAYEIAWKKIHDIRPRAFVAYLNAVTRNLALHHHRAAKNAPMAAASEEELAARVEADAEREGRSDATDPEKIANDAERSARLARALREDLTDREREIVIMRFYQDMKVEDIAEELDISRNTVRNTLNRALATLRRKVGALPFGAPFPALLADAVEQAPAPGARLRPRIARSWLDWGTRAMAAMTAIAAVGMVGAAVNLAMAQPMTDEPVPLADPAPEPTDHIGPVLASSRITDGRTALTARDESGIVDVQCISDAGEPIAALSVDRASASAPEGTWWFSLESGTYEVRMTDGLGNESRDTITCDVKPIAPAPTD